MSSEDRRWPAIFGWFLCAFVEGWGCSLLSIAGHSLWPRLPLATSLGRCAVVFQGPLLVLLFFPFVGGGDEVEPGTQRSTSR